MFHPSTTVLGASGVPRGHVKDNAYVFGFHGFIYTALHAVSAETMRHPGVLLFTADRSNVEVTLRDGRCFRSSAMAIAPRTARRLQADGRALISVNVLPSSRWFHVLRGLQSHDAVALLDRDGFAHLDTAFWRLFTGEASLDLAEAAFDDACAQARDQLPPAVPPEPLLCDLLLRLDAEPDVNVAQLAADCGRTEAWVQQALAAALGMPVRDYQHWLAQRRVFDLLYTRRSLTEVALEAGFGDSPQFSRTFQRWYGQSPSYSRNPHNVRMFIDRSRTGRRPPGRTS